MALFFQKQQDEHVYHLCQQLAGAVEAILNPSSSRDKRIEATRVGASVPGFVTLQRPANYVQTCIFVSNILENA